MLSCTNCGFVGSRGEFIYVSSSGSGTVFKCPNCESVGDTREFPEDDGVEDAKKKANEMRLKKIKSLEKQIEKLHKLEF